MLKPKKVQPPPAVEVDDPENSDDPYNPTFAIIIGQDKLQTTMQPSGNDEEIVPDELNLEQNNPIRENNETARIDLKSELAREIIWNKNLTTLSNRDDTIVAHAISNGAGFESSKVEIENKFQ